jgi:hypothetical protein
MLYHSSEGPNEVRFFAMLLPMSANKVWPVPRFRLQMFLESMASFCLDDYFQCSYSLENNNKQCGKARKY